MLSKNLFITTFLLSSCFLMLSTAIFGQVSQKREEILFTQLLDSIQQKHRVYFTYNSKTFENKYVSREFLKFNAIQPLLKSLQRATSYFFDDLGKGYYVILTRAPIRRRTTSIDEALTNFKRSGVQLDEIVITGNRTKPRSILDSPSPIDNIYQKELTQSGQNTLDQMLTFKVPSFNTQNQAISDGTAHYNPADLRGLGPSRVLVLINGKRKNQSGQVYLNRTPGKGEVGVDLNSIPIAAISRIEILRDGASAIYGSDAIAGVINIILKRNDEFATFTSKTGITSQGDGFHFSSDFNTAISFGNGGFVNLTASYFSQNSTNRAGAPGAKDLPQNPRENWTNWVSEFPNLGMQVGLPDMKKRELFVNIEQPIGKRSLLYSFHGITTRFGRSFAYYRAPYWRQNDVGDLGFLTAPDKFIGYQPTFEADIYDHMSVAGFKFKMGNDLNVDSSITYGVNNISYHVNNSVNRDYLKDFGTSPKSFAPGGYRLSNVIANIDLSGSLSEKLSIAAGMEYKKERFEASEGDPLSYYKSGSDSFAGIKPSEAGTWTRYNIASYAQVDHEMNENLLLGAAVRYENFSDFGGNFSWKINSRYQLAKGLVFRASYNTGFRAPTLHQRHLSNSQYIPIPGSSMPLLQKTLANTPDIVRNLEVPSLFAETSKNFSSGIALKFHKNFSASIDFYQIKVKDRILFSSQIGYQNGSPENITNPVEQILKDNHVDAVQFFINAGDTKTTGTDIIVSYKNIELTQRGKLHLSLASNFNNTNLYAISTPRTLTDAGYTIFDRQEQGLITNARPKSKHILGIQYTSKKCDLSIQNTRFGEVTITAPETGGTDQKLASKIATDVRFEYMLTDKISLHTTVNNLLNVYPDQTLETTNTAQAGMRFLYSSEVQQLGQLGTHFTLGFHYAF